MLFFTKSESLPDDADLSLTFLPQKVFHRGFNIDGTELDTEYPWNSTFLDILSLAEYFSIRYF